MRGLAISQELACAGDEVYLAAGCGLEEHLGSEDFHRVSLSFGGDEVEPLAARGVHIYIGAHRNLIQVLEGCSVVRIEDGGAGASGDDAILVPADVSGPAARHIHVANLIYADTVDLGVELDRGDVEIERDAYLRAYGG